MISITRRYRFSASHRLHSDALSESENRRVYGKCNNPFGHGHDYVLEVTAAGAVEPGSGLILPRAALDRLVQDKILRRFANRNLNLDAAEFQRLVPTTENVALVITEILERNWAAYLGEATPARVRRVHLQETDRNGFEVLLPAAEHELIRDHEMENAHA